MFEIRNQVSEVIKPAFFEVKLLDCRHWNWRPFGDRHRDDHFIADPHIKRRHHKGIEGSPINHCTDDRFASVLVRGPLGSNSFGGINRLG